MTDISIKAYTRIIQVLTVRTVRTFLYQQTMYKFRLPVKNRTGQKNKQSDALAAHQIEPLFFTFCLDETEGLCYNGNSLIIVSTKKVIDELYKIDSEHIYHVCGTDDICCHGLFNSFDHALNAVKKHLADTECTIIKAKINEFENVTDTTVLINELGLSYDIWNLDNDRIIASSATSTEELGNSVYPPARSELSRHGISCAGKTAVQLRKSDYGKFDLFIGMDTVNIRNMNHILGGDPEGKIYKLMTFAGSGRDVSDPWYSRDFETAYKDIEEGCRGLLRHLREELQ